MGNSFLSLIYTSICKTILDLHKSLAIISFYFRKEIQWETVCFENASNMVSETSNKIKSKGEIEPPEGKETHVILLFFPFNYI